MNTMRAYAATVTLLLAVSLVGEAYAAVPSWMDPVSGSQQIPGRFVLTCRDSLIGTAWERVTADTGFTQMQADTVINIINPGSAAINAHVKGISRDSTYTSGFVQVAKTDTAIAKYYEIGASSADSVWQLVERVFLRAPSDGLITVYSGGASPLGSRLGDIKIGTLQEQSALVLSGNHDIVTIDEITVGVTENSTDVIQFQLRVYPQAIKTRTATEYLIYPLARVDPTIGPTSYTIPLDIQMSGYSAAEVWAKASGSDQAGYVTIRGTRRPK